MNGPVAAIKVKVQRKDQACCQEGDSEEIDEDLDLAADDGQDTGQPVTVVEGLVVQWI